MAVPLLLFVCLSLQFTTLLSLDTSQCIAPLGMESGAIKDEDITASSSFDSSNVGPHHGRVRLEVNGGAWCPKHQITTEPREWLEINLHKVHVITATETQGRFGNGQGQEFTEAYLIDYWRPKLGKWVRYRDTKGDEVLKGNTNTYLESKRDLDPPIWASRIRFLPYSYHFRTVCMRVEIYGCYWSDGIVSYSMPQGDKRGTGWEFFDATYDGIWDDELRRGLGQLTDGKVGPENFRMGYYESEKGQGWVGWKNDSRNGRPIEITFEFDRVREFTAVHIFCNNQFTKDVQVFAEAKISFSIGGKYFPGEPITYTYIEDRIFENSRNISIKLHHRVGQFVRLQLYFAARWIMISEVIFDSDVAHGNFSAESPPQDIPPQGDVYVEQNHKDALPPVIGLGQPGEPPLSTVNQEDSTYMAVIIGVLMAVILLLAVAIFLIITRHRQRKCFGSKSALPVPLANDCGVSEKMSCKAIEDSYNQSQRCFGNSTISSLPSKSGPSSADTNLLKLDDYQEPYQALKYAPYYSYSTVVMEMRDMLNKSSSIHHSDNYDYAVPELGTTPLLSQQHVMNTVHSDKDSVFSKGSSGRSEDARSSKKSSPLNQQDVMTALRRRLEETTVPEYPRHRLRMLSKLSEGAFGTVYVAEADGILEYGSCTSLGKRLVAVKFLLQEATEREKMDFHRDIKILAALEDENIARVLGVCSHEEPLCVILEYLDHGDLHEFLRAHIHQPENTRTLTAHTPPINALSLNCLLYIATQIASGMRYLETLNFVHRDLATRNCLIGKGYQVKISDFGTDNELYANDYYKIDGLLALPVRWMAWESVYLGKYTTKSDVWAFAVTLWEILTLARYPPYEGLTDAQVVENLRCLHMDTGSFLTLPRPNCCTKDLFDLMNECWRRTDVERPTFREIHLFLQRKNLGYAPST